ncbi:nuclear transport factor 2 family protein [Dyadobacter subterraneus]|uniref:Nuclear transport factor 2 family protein n=1 Tax=Dyadobacter subterraneus TaxID=2773304 RepID=A0ABR9WAM9_9BACT|nr:nuclear transport factor 2 family protein [Dyadobacter subterraneus]MBE9462536.1 nuclear transport factor 2 family protein [Dyadobacter subterraneus]
MTSDGQLITAFYTSFKNKDYKGMQSCYAENAVFNDEVFKNLNSAEVKAMWEMLCKSGKELSLTFGNVTENETGASAEWTASYLFSRTGKRVVNNIHAKFVIENNKIVSHTDTFDFYVWAKQAFGFSGLLLGWTPYFRNKVQTSARENLDNFMKKK